MTSVNCWCNDCRWEQNGWCNRGAITISEDYECECYESYLEEYKEAFYKACVDKDGEKVRKFVANGKKIEYNGYVFYTEDKITDSGNYFLTEARTGIGICKFYELEKRWEKFLERIGGYPDVTTLPIKESEDAE